MSINKKFETYKLKRELLRSGSIYEFKRPIVDDFGQKKNNEFEATIYKVAGLYHEQNGYVSLTTNEGSETRQKKMPMLLCLYDEASVLKKNDIVIINGKIYRVNDIKNIQEWSILADISLEVYDVIQA